MRARDFVAAAVATTFLPFTSAAAPVATASPTDTMTSTTARAGGSVTVAHFMFMPGRVKVALGQSVTWTFPEGMQHTTTSDQGFWDSGAKSGGATYVHTFGSAGRFAYHCSIHASMTGRVDVGLRVDAPNAGVRLVRWATAKGAAGLSFDVQVKDGGGPWTDFRVDTVRPKAKIRAKDFGHDIVKVRARSLRGGSGSGWSKPARLAFA